MLEFQEKKKIRKILYSKPVLVIIAILLAFSINGTYHMYQKVSETAANRDIALREQSALNAKQSDLQNNIELLKTDRGVEEEIRKKFRVVKNGESVIIVVGNNEENATETPSYVFVPLFDKIKSWFK